MLWGNEASVLVGDFLLGQAFRMMVEVGLRWRRADISRPRLRHRRGRSDAARRGQEHATTEDEYLAVIRGKTRVVRGAACQVGPTIANRPKAEQTACRSGRHESRHRFPASSTTLLDYGGKSAKLGKNIGDDFREGKTPSPSCWLSAAAMTASARSGSRRWSAARSRGRSRSRHRIDDQAPRAGKTPSTAPSTMARWRSTRWRCSGLADEERAGAGRGVLPAAVV